MPLSHFFDLVKFEPEQASYDITRFILKETMRQVYLGGVVGLSGGVDSALCAYMMVEALGPDKVIGVSLCETHSWDKDLEHAKLVADELGIQFIDFPITPILNELNFYEHIKDVDFAALHKELTDSPDQFIEPPMMEYNTRVKLRARGFILTHFAKLHHYFQCQTLHQSEILLGFLDPFGDAVGDIAPIHHLYKMEIFELAKHMGVPDEIIQRPPMSGNMNRDGHWTDEDDMMMPFGECDLILYLLDRGNSADDVKRLVDLPEWKVDKVHEAFEYAKVYHAIPTKLQREDMK